MRNDIRLYVAAVSAALVFSGSALAQTAGNGTVDATVVEVEPTVPGNAAPSAIIVTEQGNRSVDIAPADPASIDTRRVFVDTGVSDVRVNDDLTVVTMNQSPMSPCPSNQYVYERERPKWLFETGRLMVAMEEGATVRISFSCISGLQSINAVQFLSPPGAQVAQAMPVRASMVEASGRRQGAPSVGAPQSADAGQSVQDRARNIPLP